MDRQARLERRSRDRHSSATVGFVIGSIVMIAGYALSDYGVVWSGIFLMVGVNIMMTLARRDIRQATRDVQELTKLAQDIMRHHPDKFTVIEEIVREGN